MRALLKLGADPSAVAELGYVTENGANRQNVLAYFTYLSNEENFNEFFEAIELVVHAGGQIDPPELDIHDHCCSALASAAYYCRNLKLTKYLLDNGANPNITIKGVPLIETIINRTHGEDDEQIINELRRPRG